MRRISELSEKIFIIFPIYPLTGKILASVNESLCLHNFYTGAQWLSDRVLDLSLRLRAVGLSLIRRHCVVSLSKTHLSFLSTGSTQIDQS